MSTLAEIISTVRTLYSKRPSDDDDLSDAQWEHLINIWRAKLLRQDISDNKTISGTQEQTLCLVVNRLDKAEKNYLKTCRSYKSVIFPTLLSGKNGEQVSRIAERPLEPSYKLTTFGLLPYLLSSRTIGNKPKAVLEDSRLYVYSTDIIEEVYLTGIFEHPRLVHEWLGLADPFAPYSFEYPLSDTYLDAVYRGIIDTSFRVLKAATLDIVNDGHSPTQPL